MSAGTTVFPDALDNNPELDQDDEITSTHQNDRAVQIQATQAKVGVNKSAVEGTIDRMLRTGWMPTLETLTYAGADDPSYTLTIPGDVRDRYAVGARLKLQQSQALTSKWNFDSNSNDSVGSNNGTDTAISYSTGRISNGAVFNGTTSKITISDASNLKPTGAFTLSGWIKTSATINRVVWQSFSQNTNVAGIRVELADSSLSVVIGKNTGTTDELDYKVLQALTNIGDDTHHHIAITYNGRDLAIYIDGVLDVRRYSFAPAYAATNYVRFGVRNYDGTDDGFFSGTMDDFFLINGQALSEEAIKAIYLSGSVVASPLTLDKRFIITKTSYSAPNTTLTLFGGADYALANATISNPYYSLVKAPPGFPLDPYKWMVEISDAYLRSQASPVNGTWYNLGTNKIDIPIGSWIVSYDVLAGWDEPSDTVMSVYVTLSKANNTQTDIRLTSSFIFTQAAATFRTMLSKTSNIIATSKTSYYLNTKTGNDNINTIHNNNDTVASVIRAISAYL